LVTGFAVGAGFAFLIDSGKQDGEGGVLYASDLLGALLAAIFVPGLMIWAGTITLFIALIIVCAICGANIRFLK
jgi:hypothetical protein